MKSTKWSFVLVAAMLLGIGIAFVHAQEDEQVIVYRQRLMKGHGASMGSIGDIMKYQLPVGTAHVAMHAKAIAEYAAMIPGAFEKKSPMGMTDAKPEVWDHWDDFVMKAKALEDAAGTLASAAEGGDMAKVMPAIKGLGDSCRGCHNEYRKPEEERFERK